MKRTNWLLVAFLLINAIGCYADGNGVLYVSPKGDDRNAGTLSHPLKTIGAALGKMKEEETGYSGRLSATLLYRFRLSGRNARCQTP